MTVDTFLYQPPQRLASSITQRDGGVLREQSTLSGHLIVVVPERQQPLPYVPIVVREILGLNALVDSLYQRLVTQDLADEELFCTRHYRTHSLWGEATLALSPSN